MAKPKYRLQILLTIRARAKKRAEVALAHALAELKAAKEKLEKLKGEKKKIAEQWRQARHEMKRKISHGAFVGEGNVHVNFLRKLKEDEEAKALEIEEQKEVVAECEDGVARAKREYIDACKQLRIMEKHKDLWRKKVEAELSRREEREMDELGSIIHGLRRWRGEKAVFELK